MNNLLRSIQFWITASFVSLSVLAMLLVGFLLYSKFAATAGLNAERSTQQIVQQVSYNVEAYLNGTAGTFSLIEDKIQKSRQFPDSQLQRELDTVLDTREDIVSITFFDRHGNLVADIPEGVQRKYTNVPTQGWFVQALKDRQPVSFSSPHIQNLFKGRYPWVVSLSKKLTLEKEGQAIEGVLLLDVNFKTIDTLMQKVSLGEKGYVYMIDAYGNIVYHPQQQLIYAGLKSENVERVSRVSNASFKDTALGEERLITVQTIPGIQWKVIGVSFMDEAVTTRREMTEFMLKLMLSVLGFVVILAYFVSSYLSRPIKSLERSMKRVEQGNFGTTINVHGYVEVVKLSARFNIMVTRIRDLMKQIVEEQEEKRKREFEVLQAQINPHFLYNTLNSVVRLASSGKNEDVVRMITSLSRFFRISLSRGDNIILLCDELEHIRSYLTIQEIRFKKKFTFSIEASENLLMCKTIKLILQPIVENSIYHGFEKMVDPGMIRISAEAVGDRIRLQVKDNGLGIPPDRLRVLLRGSRTEGEGSGVGLRNVHERIQLYFGMQYGIEVASELEEGTEVNVWIPLGLE
ncbi:sensor histidine kinase [Paenibacillus sepulcri]